MNWNNPLVERQLLDLKQTWKAPGRDSRVVRAAFAYNRLKKRVVGALNQQRYRFSRRQKPGTQLRVFMWLAGGVGDVACARRLVQAYQAYMPHAQFEVYNPIPGAVQTVFAGNTNIRAVADPKRYWKDYDLVVYVCLSVKFLHVNCVRLEMLASPFMPVLHRAQQAQAQFGELLEDPFLTELPLGRWLAAVGGKRFDLMSYLGGVDLPHDIAAGTQASTQPVEKFGLLGKTYITFHDGNTCTDRLATRMWSRENWQELLQQIKAKYPDLLLVQLGEKTNMAYPQADLCLVGKTSLTELPALLQGAQLHLDTESGLVHLAQWTDTPSVVLFGPSAVDFFGYARNTNVSAGACGGCMWATPSWMHQCPLGHQPAACMQALSVEQVWQAVQARLTSRV